MPSDCSVSWCRGSRSPSSSKRQTQHAVALRARGPRSSSPPATRSRRAGSCGPATPARVSPRWRHSAGGHARHCSRCGSDAGRWSPIGPERTREVAAHMGEFVRLEVADGVGTIRLDRPKMNALNVQVQEEIRAAAARGDRARRRPGRRRLRRRAGLRGRRRHQGDGRHVLHRHGQALRRAAVRVHAPWPGSRSRSSPRSPATRWAAAASSRCAPTSASPPTTPCSASPRSCSASSPAPAAPSASPGWSARARPRT